MKITEKILQRYHTGSVIDSKIVSFDLDVERCCRNSTWYFIQARWNKKNKNTQKNSIHAISSYCFSFLVVKHDEN